MDQKIKDLWNNNKVLFFLLIPLVAVWFGRNIIIDLLVSSSNKVVGDATGKSDKLTHESDAANAQANQIKAQADVTAAKKDPVTEDWNKK